MLHPDESAAARPNGPDSERPHDPTMKIPDPSNAGWHQGANLLLRASDAAARAELARPSPSRGAERRGRQPYRRRPSGQEPEALGDGFEDFDAERVARIREEVAEGRFRINADAVAAGLLAGIRQTLSHCEKSR